MPKQIAASKYWCFTWNNFPEDWLEKLKAVTEIVEFSYGKEHCGERPADLPEGESWTPHIQGYIECATRVRPFSFGLPSMHWSKRVKSRELAAKYTQKEGDFVCSKALKPERVPFIISKLRPWQQRIADWAETEPNDREIRWVWEPTGGVGKSAMVRYLVKNHRCVIGGGKAADMKYTIVKYKEDTGYYPDLVIFDVPRDSLQYLSYTGIEEIKNGCFNSSKYESQPVLMAHPHVLIFANEGPMSHKMSVDRWRVFRI